MLRFGLVLAGIVVVLDQLSKAVMLAVLPEPGMRLIVAGFFNLVHVRNKGVSFGMLPELGPWLLSGLALVIVAVLVAWLQRARERLIAVALGLTIGGALGNVIDRVRMGAVFDFLDFHAFGYHWPAFNLADAAITVGIAVLLVGPWLQKRQTEAAGRGPERKGRKHEGKI